ncbi:MAG TPA: DNA gyrase inhibitor YacG [Kofleriaceae bacterium]|nr:DNA gyrase inhibitor YacG [Kofleriaceae bacterium]
MGSTGKSSAGRCPICRGAPAPRDENPAFPFCSERCRLIDLGNWLGETYRIPTVESPDEHASDDDDSSN